MRIERIELTHFRGTERAVVDFNSDGLTVLVGPNEIGKSSVMEGFQLLIDALDSSKSQQIKDTKPVDADKGPEVFARIRAGEYLFEIWKRWLKKPETKLTILEPAQEKLSGREAHEKMTEILDVALDRDLFRALQHELGDSAKPRSFNSKTLTAALDKAAGGDAVTDTGESETLWEKVEAEYLRYFTKTGKPNSDRNAAAERIADLEQKSAGISARLGDLLAEGAVFERLAADEVAAEQNRRELAKRLNQLEAAWKAVEGVVAERASAATSVAEAKSKASQANSSFDERERLKSDCTKSADSVERLADGLKSLRESGTELLKERDAAVAVLTAAETELDSVRSALELALEDQEHLRRVLDVEMLRERSERLAESRAKEKDLSDELALLTVDDATLEEIEEAKVAKTKSDARLQTASFKVRVDAIEPVTVEYEDETLTLAAGETRDLSGSEGLEFTLDDRVKVSVAGTAEQAVLTEDAAQATARLNALLKKHGITPEEGPPRAVEINRRRGAATAELRAIEDSIEIDLRDLGHEDMNDKILRNQEKIDAYIESRPDQPSLPKNLEAGKTAVAEVTERVAQAKTKQASARPARDLLLQRATDHEGEVGIAQALLDDETKRRDESLAELEREREIAPDADIAGAKTSADGALADAEKSFSAIESRLSELNAESTEAQLTTARESVASIDGQIADLKLKRAGSETKLEVLGREGLHSELDEVEAALEHERVRSSAVERRAAAAQLLFTRMRELRDATNRNYVAPFTERISALGRIVFGHDASFVVDPGTLRIESLVRGDTPIPYESLSTGTKEQCQLLASLATAQLTSEDGSGAPVVLDDALGSTDPERLEKMGAVLAGAAKNCQVIVLTCDSTRYRNVGSPSIINVGIDTLKAEEAVA